MFLFGDNVESDPQGYQRFLDELRADEAREGRGRREVYIFIRDVTGREIPAGQVAYRDPADIALFLQSEGYVSSESARRVLAKIMEPWSPGRKRPTLDELEALAPDYVQPFP